MKDFACGVIGLGEREFLNMTWGQYLYKCYKHNYDEIQNLKKLRMLISCWAGKEPHEIMELPGDFKNRMKRINVRTKKEIFEIAEKWGKGDWINKK